MSWFNIKRTPVEIESEAEKLEKIRQKATKVVADEGEHSFGISTAGIDVTYNNQHVGAWELMEGSENTQFLKKNK